MPVYASVANGGLFCPIGKPGCDTADGHEEEVVSYVASDFAEHAHDGDDGEAEVDDEGWH